MNIVTEKSYENVLISTDPKKVDFKFVHGFLTQSYWSTGISELRQRRAIDHSLNVSLFVDNQQAAYARVITDRATFAYLCDVFVDTNHRGQGISKMIMQFILDLPELQGLKRIMLATKDAHGLYTQFGFEPLDEPGKYMQINRPGIYASLKE